MAFATSSAVAIFSRAIVAVTFPIASGSSIEAAAIGRVDPSRTDAVHPSERRESYDLVLEASRHAVGHGGLGGGIVRVVFLAEEGRGRGDEDDRSFVAGFALQMAKKSPGTSGKLHVRSVAIVVFHCSSDMR